MNIYYCHSPSLVSLLDWLSFLPFYQLPSPCSCPFALFCNPMTLTRAVCDHRVASVGVWRVLQWVHNEKWWLALPQNPFVSQRSAGRSRAVWALLRPIMNFDKLWKVEFGHCPMLQMLSIILQETTGWLGAEWKFLEATVVFWLFVCLFFRP